MNKNINHITYDSEVAAIWCEHNRKMEVTRRQIFTHRYWLIMREWILFFRIICYSLALVNRILRSAYILMRGERTGTEWPSMISFDVVVAVAVVIFRAMRGHTHHTISECETRRRRLSLQCDNFACTFSLRFCWTMTSDWLDRHISSAARQILSKN